MKYKYFAIKLVSKNLVFIDGINRTGKLLTGSLVSSLNNVEHLEFGEIFQHLVPAIKLKKISIDFTKAFLHNYVNQILYNKFISRNVNFRKNDRTGVPNSKNPTIYNKRLSEPDGDKIIEKIESENPILPFVTHDIACNYDQFIKLKLNVKIIEIFRNPIDLVYSWHKKKLSLRYGKDKRIFTLLIEKNKKPYSQHLFKLPKNWDSFNEIEKTIMYVKLLTDRSIAQLKKNNNIKKIYITNYETIVEDTAKEMERISEFLGTTTSKYTKKFIKKDNCPKIIDLDLKIKKKKYLDKKVSKKFSKLLENMEKNYLKDIYGLKKNRIL